MSGVRTSHTKEPSPFMQVVLCLIASGTLISNGMYSAFASVMQSSLGLDRERHFWVAAIPNVTLAVGCFIVGPLMDSKGRRLGLILSSLPAAIGWLLMGVTGSMWSVLVGQLFNGLSHGFSSPAVSVFVTEVASPGTRSALTVARSITFSFGITLTYVLGYFFKNDWQTVAMICGFFPLSCLILTLAFVPESEVWMKEQRRPKRHWLLTLPQTFSRPEVFKPTIIINSLVFLRHMAGTTAIFSFLMEILESAGVGGDKYLVAGWMGVVRGGGGLLAAWVSSLGRRPPVVVSSVVTALSLLCLSRLVLFPDLPHLTLLVLFLYIVASTVAGAITQAMRAELFPTDVRGMSVSLSTLNMCISSFIAMWLYGKAMATIGLGGLFFSCGLFYVLFSIICYVFLPETHGKTLKEIELIFVKKSS